MFVITTHEYRENCVYVTCYDNLLTHPKIIVSWALSVTSRICPTESLNIYARRYALFSWTMFHWNKFHSESYGDMKEQIHRHERMKVVETMNYQLINFVTYGYFNLFRTIIYRE